MSKFKQILTIAVTLGCSKPALATSTFLPEWVEKFSLYSSSDLDFSETSNQNKLFTNCILKGFNRTTCETGFMPADFCPDSNLYFKTCLSSAQICRKSGFVETCEAGHIKDPSAICADNGAYGKCIANPCEGYQFSFAEATADGYLLGAKCLSGTEEKFQKTEKPCVGFSFDATNCGAGAACEELEGATCKSGAVLKYAECNTCPSPACSSPSINIDDYYCGGALRCLVP